MGAFRRAKELELHAHSLTSRALLRVTPLERHSIQKLHDYWWEERENLRSTFSDWYWYQRQLYPPRNRCPARMNKFWWVSPCLASRSLPDWWQLLCFSRWFCTVWISGSLVVLRETLEVLTKDGSHNESEILNLLRRLYLGVWCFGSCCSKSEMLTGVMNGE